MRALRLTEIAVASRCISCACALDDLRFHATVWYDDVDLTTLDRELAQRLAFHVALFQLNAVCSLRPDVIDVGPYARFLTPELRTLWRTIFRHVWAQWRYEHDDPEYLPDFANPPAAAPPPPVAALPANDTLLAFCGGGKDSLVALKLLERANLPFATLGYSHSIYGTAARQHALLEQVAASSARVRAERLYVIDDFMDAPIGPMHAAETPASVFAALPLVAIRGYRALVVAHEASANTPNLVWRGEPINHQWGKGWDAEQLLDRYVQTLLPTRYFSLLAPIHDEVIFELLARDAPLAARTHSCNIAKPWCGRCPKCAYVWLQFAAHLPPDVVAATFPPGIGEHYDFRALLGLADHTPFECVGSADEARLALALASARHALPPELAALAAAAPPPSPATLRTFVEVLDRLNMPPDVAERVMPLLREAAAAAARRLGV